MQDFRGLESAVGPNKEGFSLLPPLSQSLGTWSPKTEPDVAQPACSVGSREESRLCTAGALWLQLKVHPQGEAGINPSTILLSPGFRPVLETEKGTGAKSWPSLYLHLLRGTCKAGTGPLRPGPKTVFFL